MNYRNLIVPTLLTVTVAVAGCTHRDAPPMTPVENTATPTYRSTTNSYELDTAPRYTQSGIDGGEPVTLPSIGSPERFSQNTPLTSAVSLTIHNDSTIDSRYLVVASKGSTIMLSGTVSKSDLPKVLRLVRTIDGVKHIVNGLQIVD